MELHMRTTPDLVKGMLRLESWAGSQSQNCGKSIWAHHVRDEVKFKLAHKHRILISKQLSLQLVTATKDTTWWIIFSNV